MEDTGVKEEHVPQDKDDTDAIQPIKNKDTDEALSENEALPDNEALPENKGDEGEIEDEDEIPYELSHPITLTTSIQALYGMYHMRNIWKQDYIYKFTSVMHHAMTQVSLEIFLKQFREKGEKAVSKEFLQIHMKSTLRALTEGDITERVKYEAA